jgi:hypothetical protein
MFNLKNTLDGDLAIGNYIWTKGETKALRFVNSDIRAAVAAGSLLSDADVTPIEALADITNTLTTWTDSSTGTAPTIASQAATIAAITTVAHAANAIAGLVAEANRTKTLMTALIARIELLENAMIEIDADRLRDIKVA